MGTFRSSGSGRAHGRRSAPAQTPRMEMLEPRLMLDADWTVLVYMCGDNDLEGSVDDKGSYLYEDINAMEEVGSNDDVKIVVQVDRIDGEDASHGNWKNTKRGLIKQDSDKDISTSQLDSVGELNMGDPDVLSDFIEWGVATYPAERYMLVLWDHGGGIYGVCEDWTSDRDSLAIPEVSQALADAGQFIDLLQFDACLMGMIEQAYEVADYADIMTASQKISWTNLLPYDEILGDLVADPGQTTEELASMIVAHYEGALNSKQLGKNTYSAIDVSDVANGAGSVASKLDSLVTAIISDATGTDYSLLVSHRNNTPHCGKEDEPGHYGEDYRDLGGFLSLVAADTWLTASISDAAQEALDAYNGSIVANYSGVEENCTGMSIFFPAPGASLWTLTEFYQPSGMEFVEQTRWSEFLDWWQEGPLPGSIYGGVWEDVNSDGVWDVDESPLAGWTVYLDMNNNGSLDDQGTMVRRATDVPKALPALQTTTSVLDIGSLSGSVTDVNVSLDITHACDSDLAAYLVGPTGQRVLLFSGLGGNGDNFTNTTFDDEVGTSITQGVAPFSGTYRPQARLSGFDGLSVGGVWSLEIQSSGSWRGTLNSWSLTLAIGEPTAQTNANGLFVFPNMPAGDYVVREVVAPAWIQNWPASGYYSVSVSEGVDARDNFFGNQDARPEASDQAVSLDEDSAGHAITLVGSDAQTPAGDLTYAVSTRPEHGSVSIAGDVATYIPDANYNGSDSFGFVVTDTGNPDGSGTGVGTSDPATVTITVNPVNDPPVALASTTTTEQETPVTVVLAGTDIETLAGDLTFAISRQPDHGTVTVVGDQATYTPEAGYDGLDTFEFTATDDGEPAGSHANPGDAVSAAATVSIGIARGEGFTAGAGAVLTTSAGVPLVASITGPGNATIYTVADLGLDVPVDFTRLTVTGATAQTRVTLSCDGVSRLGGVTVPNGSLDSFDAPTIDLVGDFDVADGSVGSLSLHNAAGGTITVGAPAEPGQTMDLRFNQVADMGIDSDTPIGFLAAAEWLDTGGTAEQINAPRIGKLAIGSKKGGGSGNFAAGLVLSDAGLGLGKGSILGTSSGDWHITGGVKKLSMGLLRGELVIDGNARNLRINDALAAAAPVAGQIGRLQVGGSAKVRSADGRISFTDAELFSRSECAYCVEELRCYNEANAWWQYDVQCAGQSPAGPDQSTVAVVGRDVQHFQNMAADQGSITESWRCLSGQSSLDSWNIAWAGENTATINFETLLAAGPADMQVGQTYESQAYFDGTWAATHMGQDVAGSLAGTATLETALTGHEQITVPCGTYLAVRGQSVLSISGTVEFESDGCFYYGTLRITQRQTWWAAPGVGIVRGTSDAAVDVRAIGGYSWSHRLGVDHELANHG